MTRSIDAFRSLSRAQRHVFVACFLGWTLDAFDFFLVTFVVAKIAEDFGHTIVQVAFAITITLMFRPLGALLFGICADRFGRRTPLMINILLYSLVELLTAFSPNLTAFIVLRAIFGICMGGEWGIGAALTMESLPTRLRGVASGILQEGYAFGYLLAAIVYGLLFDVIGWRGMFMVGVLPALLVLYIRRGVEESPAWEKMRKAPRPNLRDTLRGHWGLLAYVVVLMTAFNFFSHGTQDMYPTFLQTQRGFSTHMVSLITIVSMLGAIVGGLVFGALSERIGRRKAIIAATALALPVIPLWSYAAAPVLLGIGAFLIQIAVQGAWGVIPVHLNELSPGEIRGTFPGLAYQLGNLLASGTVTIQAAIAADRGGNYSFALAVVAASVAVLIIVITWFGPEAHGVSFNHPPPTG